MVYLALETQEIFRRIYDSTTNSLRMSISGTVSGDLTITGDLTVNGSSTVQTDESVTGTFDLFGTMNASSSVDLAGDYIASFINTFSANAAGAGGVYIKAGASSASGKSLVVADFASNEDLVVYGDGDVYMRGKVGIGDNTPDFILDVEESASGSTASISITNSSASADSPARVRLRAENGDTKLLFDSNAATLWNVGMDKTNSNFIISENATGALETTPALTFTTSTLKATFAGELSVPTTKKLYLDGGGNTYIYESSADVMSLYAGNVNIAQLNSLSFKLLDGTAANPALTFINDPNTGFYRSAADTLRLSIGGISEYYWSSTVFQVGTNTFTPVILNEEPTGINPVFSFLADSDTGLGHNAADELSLIAGATELMRLDNNDSMIYPFAPISLGSLEAEQDSGAITLFNMPVSSTPTAGDEMSASFSIDSEVILKVYAEADGTGGIQNKAVVNNVAEVGSITTITSSSDSLDVGEKTFILCDTTSGDITIGGLSNGVAGQRIVLYKPNSSNNLIVEHNEATGTQKIIIPGSADITFADYGGMTLICNGTYWYVISE
jgi:hypothetical protein